MYRSRHCTIRIMYQKRNVPKWIFLCTKVYLYKNLCTEVVCTEIVTYRKRPTPLLLYACGDIAVFLLSVCSYWNQ